MLKESNRLATLLNIGDKKENLEEFGLGKERTLKEYEEFAGIEFKTKTVYMKAETGDFENKSLEKKLSYKAFPSLKNSGENIILSILYFFLTLLIKPTGIVDLITIIAFELLIKTCSITDSTADVSK